MADTNTASERRPRQIFTADEKYNIYNLYETLLRETPDASHNSVAKSVASTLGIHWVTVYRILKEKKTRGTFQPPKLTRHRPQYLLDRTDDDTKEEIKRIMDEFNSRNEIPTVARMLTAVNENRKLGNYKRTTLHKLLTQMGYKFPRSRPKCATNYLESSVEETLKDGIETVVVKVESDELTVEEDDPLEQLEKKRQREGEATQTETKKPRLENVNVIPTMMKENDLPSTSCRKTNAMVPDIFMKRMLRTQNEILNTLKTQVLMQNPDPKLLTFLRFLGAKMQKLSEERKKELQGIITKMLFEEHDAQ